MTRPDVYFVFFSVSATALARRQRYIVVEDMNVSGKDRILYTVSAIALARSQRYIVVDDMLVSVKDRLLYTAW